MSLPCRVRVFTASITVTGGSPCVRHSNNDEMGLGANWTSRVRKSLVRGRASEVSDRGTQQCCVTKVTDIMFWDKKLFLNWDFLSHIIEIF